MRKYVLLMIILILLGTSLLHAKSTNEKAQAVISLNQNILLEDAIDLVASLDLDQVTFNHVSKINGRIYYGGYVVKQNQRLGQVIISDYKKQYVAMLNEGIAALKLRISELEEGSELRDSAEQVLEDQLQRLKDFNDKNTILIYSIMISGEKRNINRLSTNKNVSIHYIVLDK